MSSFNSQLHQLTNDSPSSSAPGVNPPQPHNNPHAIPTPIDLVGLFRHVQDQYSTLAADSPDANNREFLQDLYQILESDMLNLPKQVEGVSQEFLDTLERVPKKQLKQEDACPICAEKFLDDQYPLVVELQCHSTHRFDLDCVAPWLQLKGTCPMCRQDLTKYDTKKKGVSERIKKLWEEKKPEEEEDEEDPDMLYG